MSVLLSRPGQDFIVGTPEDNLLRLLVQLVVAHGIVIIGQQGCDPGFVHGDVAAFKLAGKSREEQVKALDQILTEAPGTSNERKGKKTAKVVDLGSVEMKGQRLVVRIITSEYLRVQRLTKYKYEVLSPGSRYLGNVDLIFSNLDMRAGHHYEISVNRDTANPRVMRIIQEAER